MRLLLLLVALAAATTGCSTMAGVGKDLETGGQAIQRAAKK